jgi:hypothetical protein
MKSQSTRFTLAPAMVLTLFLAACGAAAPPVAELGFEEDFAQEFCRFGSMEGSTSKGYGCVDGEFRAWIDNDQEVYDFIAASAGERLGDVRLEADVRFVEGAEAGAYLLCRGSQESGSFYLFRLGADGAVEITDYLDGEEQVARLTVLDEGMLQPGWNRLRADCLGNQLSLYLNGQRVLEREMEGEALGPGDFALGAGGASEGLSDVYFDNLVVSTP